MNIGKRLKEIINDRGMTIKEFANEIKVPPTTIYSLISRESGNISFQLVLKICSTLKIGIFDLLDDDEYWNIHYLEENKRIRNTIKNGKAHLANTDEQELIVNYYKLNDHGRKEAQKRIRELTEISEYQNTDTYKRYLNKINVIIEEPAENRKEETPDQDPEEE